MKAKGHGEYTELAGTDATKSFFAAAKVRRTARPSVCTVTNLDETASISQNILRRKRQKYISMEIPKNTVRAALMRVLAIGDSIGFSI